MLEATKTMKLDEIASRIRAHLKRLEDDEAWNVRPNGGRRLWNAFACRAGSRVACTYVSYQGTTKLTRDDALRYLAALEGGFKGRHFEAFRQPNLLPDVEFSGGARRA